MRRQDLAGYGTVAIDDLLLCHTYGIRTTLDIDDRLMEVPDGTPPGDQQDEGCGGGDRGSPPARAVDWLLANAGKIEIEDVSKEMRAIDRRI
jgi:hypothetical protein